MEGLIQEITDNERHWSFTGSLLYSITIITTIGYGNVAPKTTEGKLMTIFYAIIGVPLMLICLSGFGTLLADTFRCIYSFLCCNCLKQHNQDKDEELHEFTTFSSMKPTATVHKNLRPKLQSRAFRYHSEDRLLTDSPLRKSIPPPPPKKIIASHSIFHSETEDTADEEAIINQTPSHTPLIYHQKSSHRRKRTKRIPISIVVLILIGYVCIGALFFKSLDSSWTYLDGAYFCFVVLSTIGFGDLNPTKSFDLSKNGRYELITCCAYLIIGLIIIAMAVTLIQEEILNKCRRTATTLGLATTKR